MATGIGQRIRQRRKELGLSQEELAARLNLKSKSTICKIERGDDNLTTTSIELYAKALNTTPSYLMGWDEIAAAGMRLSEQMKPITDMFKSLSVQIDDAEFKKAIEIYKEIEKLPQDKQIALKNYLRFLQSDS